MLLKESNTKENPNNKMYKEINQILQVSPNISNEGLDPVVIPMINLMQAPTLQKVSNSDKQCCEKFTRCQFVCGITSIVSIALLLIVGISLGIWISTKPSIGNENSY